ncbi:MinD/ParA family protein [Thermovenabulum sp.]|uniref:MinD/ParA family protein n=1 Tax=Thermovenabulum sp. TaxID=3100335 RepID=UPI003C7C2802
MLDQAHRLRELIKSKEKASKQLRIIAVSSGKGGVGKTNFSVNLAIILKELGKKVLLIDADFGLANVDVISGIFPKYNLSHVINKEKKIDEIIFNGPSGIKIIPGATGLYEMANLSEEELANLMNAFEAIKYDFDFVIIDTGAGIHKNVVNLLRSSNEVIVITTPEPSAITDAYAVIKLVFKDVKKIYLVVNRVDNYKEADLTAGKIANAAKKFLNVDLEYLGYILEDKVVSKANKEQVPFYIKYKDSLSSKCVLNIGKKLIYEEIDLPKIEPSFATWFEKLISNFIPSGGK